MRKRLCDLVTVDENNLDCVVLSVKFDTKPIDLINLGGFDGRETMFRVSKDPDSISVTVFKEDEKPFSFDIGSRGSTVLNNEMRKVRELILECVHLDFGIYTHGTTGTNKSFRDLVGETLGPRNLDSERRYKINWRTDGGYASVFVNNQHVCRVPYDDVERWKVDRNIVTIQDWSRAENRMVEYGKMERRERTLERPEVFCEIKWCREDLKEALKREGIPATDYNVDIAAAKGKRCLQERSTEEGWEILSIIINDLDFDGLFEKGVSEKGKITEMAESAQVSVEQQDKVDVKKEEKDR